jgi:hypothetical protein
LRDGDDFLDDGLMLAFAVLDLFATPVFEGLDVLPAGAAGLEVALPAVAVEFCGSVQLGYS